MLDLSQQEPKAIRLTYAALNLTVELSWRMPTTEEIRAYQTDKYRAQEAKTEGPQFEAGLSVLTGIKDGDFAVNGSPLSSTVGSDGYQDDWKDVLKASGPIARRIIADLGGLVFDGAYMEAVEKVPFVKS